jgi:hypothetical protein
MHRSVVNSKQIDYYTCDLERLFQLQPRQAQKLMELMPRVQVGPALVVERPDLIAFLDRVRDAGNVPELFKAIRAEGPNVTQRKFRRTLELDDLPPLGVDAMPRQIKMTRGHMEVDFEDVDELLQLLWTHARIMFNDEEAFRRRFNRIRRTREVPEFRTLPPVNDDEVDRILRGPGGMREWLEHRTWEEDAEMRDRQSERFRKYDLTFSEALPAPLSAMERSAGCAA